MATLRNAPCLRFSPLSVAPTDFERMVVSGVLARVCYTTFSPKWRGRWLIPFLNDAVEYGYNERDLRLWTLHVFQARRWGIPYNIMLLLGWECPVPEAPSIINEGGQVVLLVQNEMDVGFPAAEYNFPSHFWRYATNLTAESIPLASPAKACGV